MKASLGCWYLDVASGIEKGPCRKTTRGNCFKRMNSKSNSEAKFSVLKKLSEGRMVQAEGARERMA